MTGQSGFLRSEKHINSDSSPFIGTGAAMVMIKFDDCCFTASFYDMHI
jgi:hypothetical protein